MVVPDAVSRKHIEGFEVSVKDRRCVLESQPPGDHRGVHTTEVGCVDEIVAFVQLRQAWNFPVMPTFNVLSGNEH